MCTTKGTRLRLLREAKNITLDEAGKAINKTRQTVFKYEHDIITNIPSDIIIKLANLYGSTPAHIMGWEENYNPLPPYEGIIPIKKKSFPLIGSIAAGKPIDAQENIETYVTSDDEDLDADYALRVKGDSMSPRINNGDIVFIKQQPDVENGEIAAVYIDGSATLKQVYKTAESVELWSINSNYRPMIFSAGNCDDFHILGKAVKKLTDV